MAIEKFKKLVKLSGNENENEYFEYTDDPDFEEIQPNGGRRLFAFSFYGTLLTLGITFGANIALNSGSGTGLEFGQGKTLTISCQSTVPVVVTPYAGFQNASGGGFFGLDSIILEGVHQECVGKDFIIKVYNNTGDTPLTLTYIDNFWTMNIGAWVVIALHDEAINRIAANNSVGKGSNFGAIKSTSGICNYITDLWHGVSCGIQQNNVPRFNCRCH